MIPNSQPPCPAGPLDGCYFTLAAIKGREVEGRARRLIQQNGGRVFTETTLARVLGEPFWVGGPTT